MLIFLPGGFGRSVMIEFIEHLQHGNNETKIDLLKTIASSDAFRLDRISIEENPELDSFIQVSNY